MWQVDHKEDWVLQNWCFQIVLLEKTLESPLDCKIKPVNPKRNQPWNFTGRTDAEAPILWPPDVKIWVIGKDSDAGKGWRQKEKRAAEDEMVIEHHQLNARESEQTLRDSEGQGSLACCSPWGSQSVRHDLMTEREWTSLTNLDVKRNFYKLFSLSITSFKKRYNPKCIA